MDISNDDEKALLTLDNVCRLIRSGSKIECKDDRPDGDVTIHFNENTKFEISYSWGEHNGYRRVYTYLYVYRKNENICSKKSNKPLGRLVGDFSFVGYKYRDIIINCIESVYPTMDDINGELKSYFREERLDKVLS